MENNDRIFNLSGLKLLYIGLALETFGLAIDSLALRKGNSYDLYGSYGASNTDVMSTILNIAAVVGSIMVLVGIHRLKPYSEHFSKTMSTIIMTIGVIILAAIIVAFEVSSGSIDGIFVVTLLAMAVVMILSYKVWREMICGVADIPGSCGDTNTFNQCMTIWRWLKISFLTALSLLMGIILFTFIGFYNYSSVPATMIAILGILYVVALIAFLVVIAMLVMKMRQIYLSYHNQLIGAIPQAPFAAPGQNPAITSSVNVSEIAEKAKGALSGGVDAIKSITQNVTRNVAQNINQHVEVSANGNMSRYTAASTQTRDNSQPGQYKINYCYKCGSPLTEGDKFCGHCGTKVPELNSIKY